jgi:hypothetical protein
MSKEQPQQPPRRGFWTSEFWMAVGTCLGPWFVQEIPGRAKAILTGVASAAYIISRGLAKIGIGRNP